LRAFEDTLREQHYVVQPTDDDIDFFGDLLPDQVEATITTDGRGELSKSHDLKRVCNSHGYEVNSTAADSSSQNGMVERPHRTLKEQMRCMMYSARLGTEFWADALLHATWLYNRTYHSKIKMTPLQAFSGQIPALDSLITFGAKITVKKPGTRPTTLNPWAYDGIFLGYQYTMHNIKYWDINTGSIKTAKHDSKDEIQYGDNPHNRSPASKHLMEVFTGSADHTTATEPEHVEIELKHKMSTSHMDLAFVSGLSNLDLEKGSNITPSPIVKKSCVGYIRFPTIIDVSSRKLWTHLIKNKDPPIEYIDKFLKRHGIRTTNLSKAIITTSETGYLAKSRAFEDTLREQHYVVQPTDK
jgi:hypothetical protein